VFCSKMKHCIEQHAFFGRGQRKDAAIGNLCAMREGSRQSGTLSVMDNSVDSNGNGI